MNDQSHILVTFTTNSGSTQEVAERIAGKLRLRHTRVDVIPAAEVSDISGYTGIVFGGPMILGWHRKALRLIRKHQDDLANIPYHIFMTAMKVAGASDDPRISIDPKLREDVADSGKLTFKEKHTSAAHYTRPLYGSERLPKPRRVALLAGKLDYTKLKFPQVLFVMLIVGARPGDRRNWEFIEQWAEALTFEKEENVG